MRTTSRLVIGGMLLLAGCSSKTSTPLALDGGDGPACDYPDASRDPACPTTHQSSCGLPCSTPGLTCAYPGVGDGDSRGCFATAMAWCESSPLSSDGGATIWICAQ